MDHSLVSVQFSSVQSLSQVLLCNSMDCSMSDFPVCHQLQELTQIYVHRVGDAIQPSHPLSSPSSPAFNLSQHQGLCKWVSSSQQVAKVLNFSFSFNPSNEYSGLLSFRMDWLDLSAVQGTLKSLLQQHSSKESIPLCSVFFTVHLGCRFFFFPFHPFTYILPFPLDLQRFCQRSTVNIMCISLYATYCFSLVAFNMCFFLFNF